MSVDGLGYADDEDIYLKPLRNCLRSIISKMQNNAKVRWQADNEKIVLPQERLALVFWGEEGQCQLMMGQELFPALCNSSTSTRATNRLQFSASMGGKVRKLQN